MAELEPEDVEDAVGGDGDALMAIYGEGSRVGTNRAAGLEIPQPFPGSRC